MFIPFIRKRVSKRFLSSAVMQILSQSMYPSYVDTNYVGISELKDLPTYLDNENIIYSVSSRKHTYDVVVNSALKGGDAPYPVITPVIFQTYEDGYMQTLAYAIFINHYAASVLSEESLGLSETDPKTEERSKILAKIMVAAKDLDMFGVDECPYNQYYTNITFQENLAARDDIYLRTHNLLSGNCLSSSVAVALDIAKTYGAVWASRAFSDNTSYDFEKRASNRNVRDILNKNLKKGFLELVTDRSLREDFHYNQNFRKEILIIPQP